MTNRKPLLTSAELVQHLKDKGVLFNIIDEQAAEYYLQKNNNYFKLASFRKNYDKYLSGNSEGLYISLEFAYLKDLAIIDMRLRYIIVQMALDIEHYVKMQLISKVENDPTEDGYSICEDYISSLSSDQNQRLNDEINRNADNIYCGSVVQKYSDDWPIWAFLEVIPFGRLVAFYKFCADRFNDKAMQSMFYKLQTCKEIRNAAAHSSCIINDLHRNTAIHKTSNDVKNDLIKSTTLSTASINKKMSNSRIQQIVTLLYTHNIVVTSLGVHNNTAALLKELKRRMFENQAYYHNNALIFSSFTFIATVIDIWYQ